MRYLPFVRERARAQRVIFFCPTPLARLLQETDEWNAEFIICDDWKEAALPHFDRHISLLSLPLALRAYSPLPINSFMRVNPDLCTVWRSRLGDTSKFRVGLAWRGRATHVNDHHRSIDLRLLSGLLRARDVNVYSLQVNLPADEPQALRDESLIDLTDQITDFADTAALMMQLDLIISVDTAVAHLAGALGRPVWTLLPFVPDWRWGLDREDTPWYPTMRLFRQPALGDWDSVIQRVADELRHAVTDRSKLLP